MPGGDRRGPMGQGPMSGPRQIFCAGSNNPGNTNRGRGAGRGFGGGHGGGWRHRHWFHATGLTGWQRAAMGMSAGGGPGTLSAADADTPGVTREQELALLRDQAAQLQDSLNDINRRIEGLAAPAPVNSTVEPAK